MEFIQVPELDVAQWLNSDTELSLQAMRGKIVIIEAFQMLCPGCVAHGLPQAKKIQAMFAQDEVEVIGLHSVFEHHEAMGPLALQAFLHEYRIDFPVAVDRPSQGSVPHTMQLYGLKGTPSLLMIDGAGRLRAHHFGQISDMQIGAEIAHLLAESALDDGTQSVIHCDDDTCSVT